MEDLREKLLIARERMESLDRERLALHETISGIEREIAARTTGGMTVAENNAIPSAKVIRVSQMPRDEKVAVFRSLFHGRDDVYALRFESKRTGRGGYQPACRNDWVPLICGKPQMKCSKCPNRDLLPVTDAVIISHLIGHKPSQPARNVVIGVFPLLADETCRFLAVDFDKAGWREDVNAFAEICRSKNVPVAIERSRSGNGAHGWIFFSQPITASLARKLGTGLLTETMEQRPEVGMDSYDRLFPNQDTMPKGGFGNLIALPFQGHAVAKGNTLFLDAALNVIPDQWEYLKSLRRLSHREVLEFVAEQTARRGNEIGVRFVSTEDNEEDPWTIPPSRRPKEPPLGGDLPAIMRLVLANEVYIQKEKLPPGLQNRILRIAAFQNPEFYRNQAMRLPTYGTPRIIGCAENHGAHIGLPIGCLDDLLALLKGFSIEVILDDQRAAGTPIQATFQGCLRPEQSDAASRMLAHDSGVLAASTAFGKTVVAIHILAKRAVNTLILVHRKQLMQQWRERLLSFLRIDPKDIGAIGGGSSKTTGVVDVAMIQSLFRKGVVSDVVANYGHLIVDECHHISAPSFEQVARRCRAKFITGLSATVIRKDGHHPIILMQCGPIRYQTNQRTDAERRPFEHRAIIRETPFFMPTKVDIRIHEIYAAITSNPQRNQLIADDAIRAVKEGRWPVVLTERRDHLDALAVLLTGKVKNLIILAGGMGKKQLRSITERLSSFPAGECRLILATGKYLGEGFDDARLDTLFLAMPISWRGTLAQYAGRLHRLHDMKREVRIHDYADVNVPMLNRMLLRRLKGYHAIGYNVETVRPAVATGIAPQL